MRLVCPNCGAQYEVGDDVVPDAGRDVQCSNCGHTWFERPGASEALDTLDPEPTTDHSSEPEQESDPAPESTEPEQSEPEHESEVDDTDHHDADAGEDDSADAGDDSYDDGDNAHDGDDSYDDGDSAHDGDDSYDDGDDHGSDDGSDHVYDTGDDNDEATLEADDAYSEEVSLDDLDGEFPDMAEVENLAATPRELDPGVADILREEAEFEQAARQSESDPIETQPDLGLSEASDEDRRSLEAQNRLARLRGEPDAVAASAAAVAATLAQDADAPRRELLPDIEEINSTLRPDAGPVSDEDYDDMLPKRSRFRRGFMFVVLLAVLALVLYIFAPQLSAAVPALEGVLTSYVAWVDGLRLWLDGQVQGLISGAEAPADAPADAEAPEG